MKRVIRTGTGAVVAAVFYWWLVAKTQPEQLAAAALVGIVVAASLAFVARRINLSFRFEWRQIRLVLRLPLKILLDLGLVLIAFRKALLTSTSVTGTYLRIPFDPGPEGARRRGRRALVFGTVSMPPNSFVVDIEKKSSLLIHQLIFQPEQGQAKEGAI